MSNDPSKTTPTTRPGNGTPDGDPTKDLKLFQEEGRHLAAIMKGGRFYKNRLGH